MRAVDNSLGDRRLRQPVQQAALTVADDEKVGRGTVCRGDDPLIGISLDDLDLQFDVRVA